MRGERAGHRPGPYSHSPAVAAPLVRLTLRSDSAAIRRALARVQAVLAGLHASGDSLAAVELVLAELLTNIQRHAYGGRPGQIELDLTLCAGEAICTLTDRGGPMPGGQLPPGDPAPVDVPMEALPEGGFGWFLIRSHASALDYRREGDVNVLTVHLPIVLSE